MKTSQAFLYSNNGDIQYIDKTRFIEELVIVINRKQKKIFNLSEVKKLNNLTYKEVIQEFDKCFIKLMSGIYFTKLNANIGMVCLIDKSVTDFEKICKKNKWKFNKEVEEIVEKNYKLGIIIKSENDKKICSIKNYKPKESKEELKMKNKKLIKQVAVASLAALMMIPNLTMTTYAKTQITVEMAQEKLEYWKSLKDNFSEKISKDISMKDIDDSIQDWQETLDDVKAGKVIWSYDSKEEYNKEKAKRDQERAVIAAKEAAAKAEKERKANTVYPLTVKYVKDFIDYVKNNPDLNDNLPHFYERPDMPGIIFTLEVDPWDKVHESNSNITILEEYDADYLADLNFEGIKYKLIKGQGLKVKYICPFECIASVVGGGRYTGADYHYDNFKNDRWRGSNSYTKLGENIIYVVRRYQVLYDKGYPAELQGQLAVTDGRLELNKPKLTVEQMYNDLRTGTNTLEVTNKEKVLPTNLKEITIDFSK